jgi:(2Fe-2S) ferredoxin
MVQPFVFGMVCHRVLICNHITCHQQGAESMIRAFQARLPQAGEVQVRNCLGRCGNGPMVLLLPEEVWYSHVQPDDVPRIVEQHLGQGQPVSTKRQGPKLSTWLVWGLVGCSLMAMVGLLILGIVWAWSPAGL